MKDSSHHLRHVQKKVIQEVRKQDQSTEKVVANPLPKIEAAKESASHERKKVRHVPAPRIKTMSFH